MQQKFTKSYYCHILLCINLELFISFLRPDNMNAIKMMSISRFFQILTIQGVI